MRRLWRILGGVLLLLLVGFCVFGFLASFEPGTEAFKAVYGIVGSGCLLAAGWLLLGR